MCRTGTACTVCMEHAGVIVHMKRCRSSIEIRVSGFLRTPCREGGMKATIEMFTFMRREYKVESTSNKHG